MTDGARAILLRCALVWAGALLCAPAAAHSIFDWGWQEERVSGLELLESYHLPSEEEAAGAPLHQKLIIAYRGHVAPIQGPRCPFLPSCSTYTLFAMNQYGVLAGFIMGIERMYLRENADAGRWLHYMAVMNSKGEAKVYDPPEANYIFHDHDWRILFILVMISCVSSGSEARAEEITTEDLRNLGDELAEAGDDFGAYLFKVATYRLSEDALLKKRLGLEIVDLCLRADRHVEADRMITTLAADFPQAGAWHDSLTYRYGYNLVLRGEVARGDLYLRELRENLVFRDRVLFLRAHNKLYESQADEAAEFLRSIDSRTFAYTDTAQAVLAAIERGQSFHRRSKWAAGLLSAGVPGLGQAYSSHYFDAIQSLIFNSLFGSAAYVAWKCEVHDRDRESRNYSLPVISTVAWSVFYIANIWNAANSANRFNRFKEMEHHEGLLTKFQVFRTETDYFLGASFRWDLEAVTSPTRRSLLAALGGTSVAIGWAVPYCAPLLPVAGFFVGRSLRRARTGREALAVGLWFGLFWYGVGAHFLLWLMRYSPLAIAFYVLAIAYALPAALLSAWIAWRLDRHAALPRAVGFALAFSLTEFLRTLGDLSMPADGLAHAFGNIPVWIAWIRYTGPTAVCLLVFLSGGLIEAAYARWRVHDRWRPLLVGGLAIWLACPLAGLATRALEAPAEETLRIGIVQPSISVVDKLDPSRWPATWERLERLTREAASGADLVLWPETTRPDKVRWEAGEPFHDPEMEQLTREVATPILYGCELLRLEEGGFQIFNGAAIVWPDGRAAEWYGKQRLLPFAEGIPFAQELGLDLAERRAASGGSDSYLTMLGNLTPGPRRTVFEVGAARIGVLICYEGLYSSLARECRRAGANTLVVITNDAWWGRSLFPGWHARMLAARALELNIPVIRAANNGISSFTDRGGHLSSATSLDEVRTLHVDAQIANSAPTFYARTGDIVVVLILVALGAAIGSGFRRKRAGRADHP